MNPFYSTRLDAVYGKACRFIVSQNIRILPADPFEVIRRNKWGLVTYRQLAESADGIRVEDIVEASSPDGFTIYNGNNYCIAYNSEINVFARIIFTLFHEIGHIFLGHFTGIDSCDSSIFVNSLFENEANYFASNVMAPSVVIQKCNLKTPESIRCACGMSYEAAEKRLMQYESWVPSSRDDEVFRSMRDFIRYSAGPRYSAPIDIDCEEARKGRG